MDFNDRIMCDICKRRAATHHEIKLNGGTVVHMCHECRAKLLAERAAKSKAAQSGDVSGLSKLIAYSDFSSYSPFSELNEFAGFLASMPSSSYPKSRQDKICGVCGRRASEFLNTGYLGCDRCYSELKETVLPAVQKLQSSLKHTGKTPYEAARPAGNEYERLLREYTKAMEEDKFEEAAVLKERMRALKENIRGGGKQE
jgi:protein arginine kinase activator